MKKKTGTPGPEMLKVNINGRIGEIPRRAYVTAKAKDLRAFGYTDLGEADIDAQITALQEGKKLGEGLTVIGKFMEDEIVKT